MYIEDMLASNKFTKKNFIISVLFVLTIVLFYLKYEKFYVSNQNYLLLNSKNEIIHADFFDDKDGLLMFKLKNDDHIVSIMDKKYLGINDGRPLNIGTLFLFKKEDLTVNIVSSNIRSINDTLYFKSFIFYNFKLGKKDEKLKLIKK